MRHFSNTPVKDNIRKLVDALRSGEFHQGAGGLRPAESRHCCLGVACEIYRRETGIGNWVKDALSAAYVFEVSPIEESSGSLTSSVREWYGFDRPNPHVGSKTSPSVQVPASLAQLNDRGICFATIADDIESTYLKEKA